MRPRRLAAVAAVAVVAGCGGDDAREEIAEQVRQYALELADGRWEQACERLTPAARERLGGPLLEQPGEEDLDCDAALERVQRSAATGAGAALDERRVREEARVDVQVGGEQATAMLRSGRLAVPAALREVDGEWLIEHFGPVGETTALPGRPPVP